MADLDDLSAAAQKYIKGYLTLETQEAEAGPTDSQLAGVVIPLLQQIARAPAGVLLDIGAGTGPLFSRLYEDASFREASNWLYVAVEEEDKPTKFID